MILFFEKMPDFQIAWYQKSLGIQSPCQMMIGVYNYLLRKVFRFHETILRRWARIPREWTSTNWKSLKNAWISYPVGVDFKWVVDFLHQTSIHPFTKNGYSKVAYLIHKVHQVHFTNTSWWLNQPISKICSSNWIISTNLNRLEHKKIFEITTTQNMLPLFLTPYRKKKGWRVGRNPGRDDFPLKLTQPMDPGKKVWTAYFPY